jgi:hypothetical protein
MNLSSHTILYSSSTHNESISNWVFYNNFYVVHIMELSSRALIIKSIENISNLKNKKKSY